MVAATMNKKKNVVKHRTRSGFQPNSNPSSGSSNSNLKGKGKAGFKVGPSHAPDGSYLGKMKKRKAELIEKAKIKKRFFKGTANQSSPKNESDQFTDIFSERDEGRFAPEQGEVQDGLGLLEIERAAKRRRREQEGETSLSKKEQAKAEKAKAAEIESKRRLQGGFMHTKKDENENSISRATLNRSENDTADQRKEERQKRKEKWNTQSGSKTGRQRGQPNLGARMDLLLDKIKQA